MADEHPSTMPRNEFCLNENLKWAFWQICTKDDVVCTPYKAGPDVLVFRCYRGRITAHTSARRKYATKYVNVFGDFLHCIKEIQIYLRVRPSQGRKRTRAPVSSRLSDSVLRSVILAPAVVVGR